MRPDRRMLVRSLAVSAIGAPLVSPAVAGEPARPVKPEDTFYQSEDKSFDFIVPKGWSITEAGFMRQGEDPRRFFPVHLFKVTASDSSSHVEVTVDLGYGTSLRDLGTPEVAVQRLLPFLPGPPAQVKSVERVQGAVKGSSFLLVRTEDGRALKVAVIQKRLFAMSSSGPSAEAVLETFQAWPINIFCQSQSNSGGRITPGTCY
eukprot:CAMPEP_0119342298 /NCGR_PEP_ID=MMETSP1333-20130426/104422_1 /TAXON_ID=418940 /ORGANISM="Scyphosphaera apsteinii, Strain RCC1455" /LENGTH=203 /DNA_ID=CAMNT_0007354485 /DNA_START=93 /DNA_END=704 /DNA_ORIENTATION=-